MTLSNTSFWTLKVLVVLVLCFSCSSEKDKESSNLDPADCLYNAPVAIFQQVQDSLLNYTFERLGDYKTSESFELGSEQVEIIQSGCDQISQEFRFQTNSELEIVDYASDIFNRFSALDPSLFALNQFANEFQRQGELIKTGQKIQFSEIIYLKMDETPMGESRIIRILMTSEKN